MAGDQEGELYRLTLIAQCNALSNVMPFLFEHIDNETELLLPDNLLLTDSVIAKLVTSHTRRRLEPGGNYRLLHQFLFNNVHSQRPLQFGYLPGKNFRSQVFDLAETQYPSVISATCPKPDTMNDR